MATTRSSLPGAIPSRIATSQVSQPRFVGSALPSIAIGSPTTFKPHFYPDSLPYQIDPIPEAESEFTEQDPGVVFGVPPDATGAELPSFNQLSEYITRPHAVYYVGEPLNAAITPTGSATAPFAEITDAMTAIAAQSDVLVEVNVGPGGYAAFTIPSGVTVILRGTAFTVPSITVAGIGPVVVFLGLNSFQGTAPSITFATPDGSNGVYFDSPSAQAFGLSGGTIVDGVPICGGPGPYLAVADSAFVAFSSAVLFGQYEVALADGTIDGETIGVVYPGVGTFGSGELALVWPTGTVIPNTSGIGAGIIYRATNGSASLTVSTQQIGIDDEARFYVAIQSVPFSSIFGNAVTTAMAGTPVYMGENVVSGTIGLVDARIVTRASPVAKIVANFHSPLVDGTSIIFQLLYSTDHGATYSSVPGATVTITASPTTPEASFAKFVMAANSLHLIAVTTVGFTMSGFPVSCTVSSGT